MTSQAAQGDDAGNSAAQPKSAAHPHHYTPNAKQIRNACRNTKSKQTKNQTGGRKKNPVISIFHHANPLLQSLANPDETMENQ